MNTKISKLFWLFVTTIALNSIILSYATKNSNITTIISLPNYSQITSIKRVIFNQTQQFFSRLQRSPAKLACDASKWKSPLIAKYRVALILTVDKKGCGKFNTLKKAVDAVPDNAQKPTLIIVDSGTYTEKVEVKKTKSNLIIQGQGYQNTFIAWHDTARSSKGTVYSYTVGVFSDKFIAYDISFKNTAPDPGQGTNGGQAVAFRIMGDQAAFYKCGFYGYQDTLHDDLGRHYFKSCFIQGSVDFIFGNGRSLYDDCTINSVASGPGINGVIAAQQRASLQDKTGFSFVNCKIQGKGNVWLGRAWGKFSTILYIKTSMEAIITPERWNNWKDSSRDQNIFFGEHASTGPGANFKSRVKFAKNLSLADAKPYMDISYINGKEWTHGINL